MSLTQMVCMSDEEDHHFPIMTSLAELIVDQINMPVVAESRARVHMDMFAQILHIASK